MNKQTKLLNQEVSFCTERNCLVISESYETTVSEDEILTRAQYLDFEIKNYENEIVRLNGEIEGKKQERAKLLKHLTLTLETMPQP